MSIPEQPKQWYPAACHCHAVEYKMRLPADLYATRSDPTPGSEKVIIDNCSICLKNGYILMYPLSSDVQWLKGKETLKAYTFGSKSVDHRFCPECGSSIMIDFRGSHPLTGEDCVGMNMRMVKGVDIERLQKIAIMEDGRNKINPQINEQTA